MARHVTDFRPVALGHGLFWFRSSLVADGHIPSMFSIRSIALWRKRNCLQMGWREGPTMVLEAVLDR